MHASLVLTLIGADRPGLVETVARVVADHHGNWVESRMARLAGRFAGVLRVDLPLEHLPSLRDALNRLKADGLTVIAEDATGEAEPEGPAFVLELLGHDRPGIVRDVAHALAARQVNVITLETEMFSAAMSGERLFKVTAHLRAPTGLHVDELRRSLDAVAAELHADLRLDDL